MPGQDYMLNLNGVNANQQTTGLGKQTTGEEK